MNDLRRLPLLDAHRDTLERCVYCPKLCRATCVVSNEEPSETLTPWGKMSTAYFLARGNVAEEKTHAATAWACTSCHACTGRCDHRNDVGRVLDDARAELFARGLAPDGAVEVVSRFEANSALVAKAARSIGQQGANQLLVVGCGYLLHAPREAEEAVRVVAKLTGERVSVAENCCGLPLLHGGDRAGFLRASRLMRDDLRGKNVIAVDPGCAQALNNVYSRHGVEVRAPRLFVDVVANAADALSQVDAEMPLRFHDPCQLGRGLGRYREPRKILERVTGRPPLEFDRSHHEADCSGGGGALPATMKETSRTIADARIAQHHRGNRARLVTHCASSLRRFRSAGEPTDDLIHWAARGLGLSESSKG
jgi:Fe-S oxidoreductase